MKITEKKKMTLMFLVGCLLGAFLFIWVYGYSVLDPTYEDWLMQGDLAQHYLGWKFYRDSPWHFPIGLIDGLVYPNLVSVVYTDSIPLFAIIFKIFSPILPNTFHYFGIWGIMCFMLQGGISANILKKITNNNYISIVGSIFFILSPVVLQRMYGHTALAGHWIILLAIGIWVYRDWFNSFKRNLVAWNILFILSVSVHMYFVPMVLAIMFFYLLQGCLESKNYKQAVCIFISSIITILATLFVLGGLYGVGMEDTVQHGLGIYSANLNALFNSQGASRYLQQLPLLQPEQAEGFAYIGLGVLIFLIVGMCGIFCVEKNWENIKNKLKNNSYIVPIVCTIIVLFIFSLSPRIALGNKIILNFVLPESLFNFISIFRATGRFMWPIIYFIMIISVYLVNKYYKKMFVIITISICVLIQISDLSNYAKAHFINSDIKYNTTLQSKAWEYLGEEIDSLNFITLKNDIDTNGDSILWNYFSLQQIFDVGYYANKYSVNMNDFYIGRKDTQQIDRLKINTLQELKDGESKDNELYMFSYPPIDLLSESKMHFYEIDSYIIGVKNEIPIGYIDETCKKIDINEFISILPTGNKYISNGEFMDKEVILFPNGNLYGPYLSIPKGKYEVKINGINLLNSYYDVIYNGGEGNINISPINIGDNEIIYQFESVEDVKNVEFRIMNIKDQGNITINELAIKFIND